MEALVWKDTGVETERSLQPPANNDREVLIRVRAAGVCTTDIHMIQGKLNFAKPPWILGHEMAGVVERTGAEVAGWKAGDAVVVDPVVSCGNCTYCQQGKKHLCSRGGELGTTCGQGGYGQYVVVPPSNLYRLPAGMSFVEGAMMEPLNCTMGAVDRVPRMAGAHAVVFGPGPAGLLFAQLAKVYGASTVTMVGMDNERLELGKRLGADLVVNIRSPEERKRLDDMRFDVAIEASGSPDAVRDCFALAASGGTVVLYGLSGLDRPSIVSDQVVGKDLTVVTCISAPHLWEQGIRLTASGRINVKDMVTHPVPFDDAQGVLNDILKGRFRGTKAVILHNKA
ncbi:zinc-dependent alcohol dehydrogenase [Cohnella zeiphila]|uniref:Alcohol dehydrogenase catalytic domain-containing protein n=1 Tax=Cohnella zeiphila TaxID=2761120 RepID=A0A7X0VXV9_9BACL|nr:alcohol dehydrogenase catalytic domain-containing protein [Cohnella zeiphila]MBB6734035.1 alcohol dehydrogenase catalytic domain-containing protein [Cohnella zeiphila]